MSGRRKLLLLITLTAVSLLLLYNYELTDNEPSFHFDKGSSPEQAYFAWESQYRFCLIKTLNLGGIQYGSFRKVIEACNGGYALELFHTKIFFNGGDNKLAVLPRTDNTREGHPSCTFVTLGVGFNIYPELELQKLVPHCQFHGADPSEEAGLIYKNVGKYYPVAVNYMRGNLGASVLRANSTYTWELTKTVTLLEFLKDHVNSSRIDYLSLDNEFPEWGLLPQFLYSGVLHKADIVVCQISMEMHGPVSRVLVKDVAGQLLRVGVIAYNDLLMSLLTKSPLLPLWAERNITVHSTFKFHERSFYINSKHPYCVKKFFSGAFEGAFG